MNPDVNPDVNSFATLQRLAANVPGMMYQSVLRANGTEAFTYVSPGCQEIYELAPQELLQDFQQVWEMIHPDDRVWVNQVYHRSAEQLERFDIEFRLLPPSGGVRWVRAISQPEAEANGDILWDGFVQDISEHKRLEAERRQAELTAAQNQAIVGQQLVEIEAIYRTAPVGLALLDRDLRFVRLNQQLAEINGLPIEAHLGRTVREIVPNLADTTEPLFRRILATGEPLLNLEVQGETVAQPGIQRTWLENWFPFQNVDGQIIGINAVVQEITDRKRVEVELLEKQQLIEQMNEELEATNEELQSANQELETTNEELQSTNEELRIINEALRQRTIDLNQVNSFLDSILTSLQAGMVVINTQGNILSWNHEAQNLWGLWVDEVQGKSFFGLDIGLPITPLQAPIANCLNGQIDRQVLMLAAINRRGRAIQCRVSLYPLMGVGQERQGVILLMEEVTP